MRKVVMGFDQQKLVDLGMDAKDPYLLDWILKFRGYSGRKMLVINNDIFFWTSYQKIASDLPIIGIASTRGLRSKFQTYEDKGLIKRHITKDNKLYICTTKKFDELLDFNNPSDYLKEKIEKSEVKREKKENELTKKELTEAAADVLVYYNTLELPKYNLITPVRRRLLEGAIKEYGSKVVKQALKIANDSVLLQEHKANGAKWYKFDWIFKKHTSKSNGTIMRLLEGDYDFKNNTKKAESTISKGFTEDELPDLM